VNASQIWLSGQHDVSHGKWEDEYARHQITAKHKNTVRLIHFDPWYQDANCPTEQDFMKMAEASTYYARPDCVMIVWFPWQKAETFMKQFIASKEWECDKACKRLVRKASLAGRYGSMTQLKSVSDQHMIFYKKDVLMTSPSI
jgi:hypothetical protein